MAAIKATRTTASPVMPRSLNPNGHWERVHELCVSEPSDNHRPVRSSHNSARHEGLRLN